mmetsp:Transcript_28271/g.42642  ORF Transcript_28271/g.42642 Transcript_28271/m.42642 type:complete len:176 (+) Transcript_28271:99-626(+)
MGLTMNPNASIKEVLTQLKQLAEHLNAQPQPMKVLEDKLKGCVNAGIMARMPFANMLAIFEDAGLGAPELLAMESVLGDGDIFPRVPALTTARRHREEDIGKRGGEQTLALPHLPKRRVTATDISDYHHPIEFYSLPGTHMPFHLTCSSRTGNHAHLSFSHARQVKSELCTTIGK